MKRHEIREEVGSRFQMLSKALKRLGGPGSGFHGHAGRPGKRGGSAGGKGGGAGGMLGGLWGEDSANMQAWKKDYSKPGQKRALEAAPGDRVEATGKEGIARVQVEGRYLDTGAAGVVKDVRDPVGDGNEQEIVITWDKGGTSSTIVGVKSRGEVLEPYKLDRTSKHIEEDSFKIVSAGSD